MDLRAIEQHFIKLGLPAYRLRQVAANYYSSRFDSFLDMSDLPKELRQELDTKFGKPLSVLEVQSFSDKFTSKSVLQLRDNFKIESVLMDYDDWLTACVSSQVGCPLRCSFCATGKMGFTRNLSSEEIQDQILYWNHRIFPKYVGRVVFMGMGEPFLNWDNLLLSLKTINSPSGLNIGQRKISISTAGISPRIKDFADLGTQINLAVSLHSAIQSVRESIMPIAKTYPLSTLIDSLNYYTSKTGRQVFFEYALIKDVNDDQVSLSNLAKLINSNRLFYLNLIPLNPVKDGLIPSTKDSQNKVENYLSKVGVPYSVRHSIGREINSACGQLIVGA